MPIYEFECITCGQRFDRLMRVSDPDPSECECERRAPVRRALTAPQFRLKGSGWYETDFKSDKETKRNLADRTEPGSNGAGGGTKDGSGDSSTKPAAPSASSTPSGSASTAPS